MEGLPQQGLYVANPRLEVKPHIPDGVCSALDVGCGAGGFGASLRDRLGEQARVVGIEAVAVQAQRARGEGTYDEVLDGYFPAVLADSSERFDLIVFNDVLEHILDPWEVLRSTRAFLTPHGHVLATIPSIQFAPVMWKLIRGRWDYTDDGTLDRTHVRFFTRATMIELFEETGYTVERCVGVNSIEQFWRTDPNPLRRAFKKSLGRALGNGRFVQFVVVARPVR